jgi:uncharacterized protein (DUF342 family)
MENNKKILTECTSCKTPYMVLPTFIEKEVACKKCGLTFLIQPQKKSEPYPVIAKLAASLGYITPHQLEEIIHRYQSAQKTDPELTIEKEMLSSGLISSQKMDTLLASQSFFKKRQAGIQFGAIGTKLGLIDETDIQKALAGQAQEFKQSGVSRLLGDILVDNGSITAEQRDAILKEQRGRDKTAIEPNDIEKPSSQNDQPEPDPIRITISDNQLEAYLVLPREHERPPSGDDVKKNLQSVGVTYGVMDDPQIEEYLKQLSEHFEPLLIAKGQAVRPGVDETVKYYFDADQDMVAGTIEDDGSIDFRDRGHIALVNQGDVLAEIIPGQEGQAGINVFGQEIPAPKPVTIKLHAGKGTNLVEDGQKILASSDGQPKLSIDGILSVYGEMKIDGDIGYRTGHVEFDGNVLVAGKIQEGFKVKCNNLTAAELLGADVRSTGHLKILGGIIGARIMAEGDIKATYIKGARIKTYGNIIVEKEIIDSDIEISGSCRLPRGKVIASRVSARRGILANEVGTEVSKPCKLKAGSADHINREISGFKEAINQRKETLVNLRQKIDDLDKAEQKMLPQISEIAQIQDRSIVGQREISDNIDSLPEDANTEALEDLQAQLKMLVQKAEQAETKLSQLFSRQDQMSEEKGKLSSKCQLLEQAVNNLKLKRIAIIKWSRKEKGLPVVSVTGQIFQGTSIEGLHTTKVLRQAYRNVTIKEVKITDPNSEEDWEFRVLPNP